MDFLEFVESFVSSNRETIMPNAMETYKCVLRPLGPSRDMREVMKQNIARMTPDDNQNPAEESQEENHRPAALEKALYELSAYKENIWTTFMTYNFRMPEEDISRMRAEVGVVSKPLKIETMRHWLNEHGGSNGKQVLMQRTQNFISLIGEFDQQVNQKTGRMLRAIADAIPNDRWTRFARVNLGLSRSEMDMLKSRYARFTEEQRYQIMKHWLEHGQMPVEAGDSDNKQIHTF